MREESPRATVTRPFGRWKELVAALGVILSMIFVGLELRQNTVAVRAAARNELAAGARDWLMALAESPELADALGLWLTPDSELTPTQGSAARYAVRALLRNVENVFFQVQGGIVPEEALTSYGIQSGVFRGPRFHDLWISERDGYDPEFVTLFETRLGIR